MKPYLEEYLDFSEPEEVKIRGHRILLHHVLNEYLAGMTLEGLCQRFDTLSRAQILACMLYYHHNQPAADKYLADLRELFRSRREESIRQHGDWMADLRRRKAAMNAVPVQKGSA